MKQSSSQRDSQYTLPHTVLATCRQPSHASAQLSLALSTRARLKRKCFQSEFAHKMSLTQIQEEEEAEDNKRGQPATCHLPYAAQAANCAAICGNLLICCCLFSLLSLSQLLHFPAISFSPLCHFFTSLPLLPASLCLFFPLSATSCALNLASWLKISSNTRKYLAKRVGPIQV